jgi:hypothetical protein
MFYDEGGNLGVNPDGYLGSKPLLAPIIAGETVVPDMMNSATINSH